MNYKCIVLQLTVGALCCTAQAMIRPTDPIRPRSVPKIVGPTPQDRLNDRLIELCEENSSSIETMADLIRRGAQINARDSFGNSALLYACIHGNNRVVEFLVSQGADVNAQGCQYSPLRLAARRCSVETCRLLLDQGALVNRQCSGGYTALMTAAMFGRKEICELLVARRAHINKVNEHGETARQIANKAHFRNNAAVYLNELYSTSQNIGNIDSALDKSAEIESSKENNADSNPPMVIDLTDED